MFTGNKKRKKILIIISLIAYNNNDFLTLTSIYIRHLLRLKSLKKIINNKHDTESLCIGQIEASTCPPRATPRAFDFFENY